MHVCNTTTNSKSENLTNKGKRKQQKLEFLHLFAKRSNLTCIIFGGTSGSKKCNYKRRIIININSRFIQLAVYFHDFSHLFVMKTF